MKRIANAFATQKRPLGFFPTVRPFPCFQVIPRRYFPCTVYTPNEIARQQGQRTQELEEKLCQAENLLYKWVHNHPLSDQDRDLRSKLEQDYKHHRDTDLDVLIQSQKK